MARPLVAGIDVGGTSINDTLLDDGGHVLVPGLWEVPARSREGPDVCLGQIETGLRKLDGVARVAERRHCRGARGGGQGAHCVAELDSGLAGGRAEVNVHKYLVSAYSFVMLFACVALGSAQTPSAAIKDVGRNVYIFEYRGYQSMFVVTSQGVLVTDPISSEAAKVYLAEIRKLTSAPIRYVVYSHHHYDHIAGGDPFKAAGATVVAHRNAAAQLGRLKNPAVVPPDRLVGDSTTLTLGDTRVVLHYLGRNHSDNSLVVSVPGERVIYAADWLPVGELIWRNIFDSYIDEWFEGIDRVLGLEWDRLVVGHARAHNPKGWGSKDDVRAFKAYFTDLKEAVRVAHSEGKCPDRAPTEVKLPKYASWFQYDAYLSLNVDRMCLYWRNGWQ